MSLLSKSALTTLALSSSETSSSKVLSSAEQQAKLHNQLLPSEPRASSKSSLKPSEAADQLLSDESLAQAARSGVKQPLIEKKRSTKCSAQSAKSKLAARVSSKAMFPISPTMSRQLVEAVQLETRAPYRQCAVAVKQILAIINSQPSCQSDGLDQLFEQFNVEVSSDIIVAETLHWKALCHQFSVIDAYKEQGRIDAEDLTQLIHILVMADPEICRLRMRHRGFAGPLCLAELHSAETRLPVKLALVQCLAIVCRLDRGVVEALLRNTTLAIDLLASGVESPDLVLTTESLNLLAGILSTLIKPPVAALNALNEKAFGKLLHRMSPENSNLPVDTVRCFVAIFLTANAAISEFSTSGKDPLIRQPLFRALLENASPAAKAAFIDATLDAFSRNDDTVAVLDHSPPQQDLMLKMLCDLTSHEATAELMKPAEIHLILNVILRELNRACDFSASATCKKLPTQLKLLENIIGSSRFKDSYKLADLFAVLRKTTSLNTISGPIRLQCQAILKRLVARKA